MDVNYEDIPEEDRRDDHDEGEGSEAYNSPLGTENKGEVNPEGEQEPPEVIEEDW